MKNQNLWNMGTNYVLEKNEENTYPWKKQGKSKDTKLNAGAPFLIDAKQNENGGWTRDHQPIKFSNFTLFNSSNCLKNSNLIWNPHEASCNWPCGRLECCRQRRLSLCIENATTHATNGKQCVKLGPAVGWQVWDQPANTSCKCGRCSAEAE